MTTALRAAHGSTGNIGNSGNTGNTGNKAAGRPALRLVIRPAPRREPPFDDEIDSPPLVGAYDQRLPFETPRPRPHRVLLPRRRRGLPEPTAWGRRLLIGLIETADGRRPLHQLANLLSPSVARGIGADFERAAVAGRPHWLHRASVLSVRCCEPAEGVAELSATLESPNRVRAVALRMEEQHGRWRCTRLQLG
jgi:hypothetical protein